MLFFYVIPLYKLLGPPLNNPSCTAVIGRILESFPVKLMDADSLLVYI